MRVRDFAFGTQVDARALDATLRDVRAILNGGVTLRDQLAGEVRTFRWNSDAAPVFVASTARAAPLEVRVLRATRVDDPSAAWVSGCAISWRWVDQRMRIDAIDVLTSSVEWDVTIAVVEG